MNGLGPFHCKRWICKAYKPPVLTYPNKKYFLLYKIFGPTEKSNRWLIGTGVQVTCPTYPVLPVFNVPGVTVLIRQQYLFDPITELLILFSLLLSRGTFRVSRHTVRSPHWNRLSFSGPYFCQTSFIVVVFFIIMVVEPVEIYFILLFI